MDKSIAEIQENALKQYAIRDYENKRVHIDRLLNHDFMNRLPDMFCKVDVSDEDGYPDYLWAAVWVIPSIVDVYLPPGQINVHRGYRYFITGNAIVLQTVKILCPRFQKPDANNSEVIFTKNIILEGFSGLLMIYWDELVREGLIP